MNTMNQLSKTKANLLIIFRLHLIPHLLLCLPLSWSPLPWVWLQYLRLSLCCSILQLCHILMHPYIHPLSNYILRLYAHLFILIYKPLLWHQCYLFLLFHLFLTCLILYLHTLHICTLLKLIYQIFPRSPSFLQCRLANLVPWSLGHNW